MQRWEYVNTGSRESDLEYKLAVYGDIGWELVTVTYAGALTYRLFFKRPLP